jgi:hypothetical protein
MYNPKVVWRWSSTPGRLKVLGFFALALPALLLMVSYGLFVHLLPPATPFAPLTQAALGIRPQNALDFFYGQGLKLRPAEAEDGVSLWNGADSVSFADVTAQDGRLLSIRLIATGDKEHGFYNASQRRAEAYVAWLAPVQGDAAAWVKACGRGPQPPLPVAREGSVSCIHKKNSSRVALIFRPAP